MGPNFLHGIIMGVGMGASALLTVPEALASGHAPEKAAHEEKRSEHETAKGKNQEILLHLFIFMAPISVGRRTQLLPITPFFAIKDPEDRNKICEDIVGVRDALVTYFNDHPLTFVNDAPDFDSVNGPLRDALRAELGLNEIVRVRLLSGALREDVDFPHSTIVKCGLASDAGKGGGEKKPQGEGGEKPKSH